MNVFFRHVGSYFFLSIFTNIYMHWYKNRHTYLCINISLLQYIYIYIYIHGCVCMCVCVCEREREGGKSFILTSTLSWTNTYSFFHYNTLRGIELFASGGWVVVCKNFVTCWMWHISGTVILATVVNCQRCLEYTNSISYKAIWYTHKRWYVSSAPHRSKFGTRLSLISELGTGPQPRHARLF